MWVWLWLAFCWPFLGWKGHCGNSRCIFCDYFCVWLAKKNPPQPTVNCVRNKLSYSCLSTSILVLVKHLVSVLGSLFSLVTAYSANQLSMEPFSFSRQRLLWTLFHSSVFVNQACTWFRWFEISAATVWWVLHFLFPFTCLVCQLAGYAKLVFIGLWSWSPEFLSCIWKLFLNRRTLPL